jgi:hypothetical protein
MQMRSKYEIYNVREWQCDYMVNNRGGSIVWSCYIISEMVQGHNIMSSLRKKRGVQLGAMTVTIKFSKKSKDTWVLVQTESLAKVKFVYNPTLKIFQFHLSSKTGSKN